MSWEFECKPVKFDELRPVTKDDVSKLPKTEQDFILEHAYGINQQGEILM